MSQRDNERRGPWPAHLRGPERGLNGDHGLVTLGILEAERGKRYSAGGYVSADPFSRRAGPRPEGGRPLSLQRGPGLRDRSLSPPSGLTREPSLYQGLSRDRSPLRGLSRELLAYPDLSRQRAAYPELSRERASYPELSRELVSYPDLYRERTAYPGLPRELPPYGGTTSSPSPSLRDSRDPLAHPGQLYALPPRDYGRSRSPVASRSPAPQGGGRREGHPSQYPSKSLSPLRSAGHAKDRSPDRGPSYAEVGILMRKVPVAEDPTKEPGHPKRPRAAFGSVVRVEGFPSHCGVRNIKEMLVLSLQLYGTVTDVEICEDAAVPYALVYFSEVEASDVALRKAKDEPLFSEVLTISPWVMLVPDKDRPVSLSQTRVMYVENIHHLVTLEDLRKVCKPFGELLDIEFKETAYGYYKTAIVQYWDALNAKIAARELNSTRVGKYIIKTTSGRNTVSKCVWVDGLPKDIEERKLLKPFEECGIVDKHLFDRKRGVALILYGAILPARQCVRSMENGKTSIGGKFVQVDYANDRAQVAFCRAMEKSGQDIGNFLFL